MGEITEQIKSQLSKQLNQHGYGFQYSVLELAMSLSAQRGSRWIFEAAEFPAEVQGSGTRIDFILRLGETRTFMLAECKRADPKFNNWCFLKAPYVRRNRDREHCFVEHVKRNPQNICITTIQQLDDVVGIDNKAYGVGRVVKSPDTKGQSGKSELDAIEQAATQICRGLNGLVELVSKKLDLISQPTTFIPVIFTTAKLYACEYNLSLANLEDGKVDLSEHELSEQDWIYYQYHLSPGIKHSAHTDKHTGKFSELLDYEYIRTIPIVTATGIAGFLKSFCYYRGL